MMKTMQLFNDFRAAQYLVNICKSCYNFLLVMKLDDQPYVKCRLKQIFLFLSCNMFGGWLGHC